MAHRIPWRRLLIGLRNYAIIVVATLIVVDVTLILLGLFPPTYRFGDPSLGWLAAPPTGAMRIDHCVEYSTGEAVTFSRNEDGVRTAVSAKVLTAPGRPLVIAVMGDSQTELCAPDGRVHPDILAATVTAAGVPATAVAYGAGRYSPVQDYLAFKQVLLPYRPEVFVLNLYTGNDFYDILRVDDRPHFVRTDTGYAIAPPVWYLYDDPTVRRRSRVLFALRTLAKRSGLEGLVQRVQLLSAQASEQGKGLPTILGYMNDLRRAQEPSVGYAGAFSAQMLNQQLFFYRFPEGRPESIRRVRALLEIVRRENPGLIVLLSPLPSYQLTQQQPVDDRLRRTLARLPITYDGGVGEERALYDTLRVLAAETGWLFADNLAALQAYQGGQRLYNDFDYHLLPVASEIVGHTQAQVLLPHLRPARR